MQPYVEAAACSAELFARPSSFQISTPAPLVNSVMQRDWHRHRHHNQTITNFTIAPIIPPCCLFFDEFIFPPNCTYQLPHVMASTPTFFPPHRWMLLLLVVETNFKFVTSWRDNCDTQSPRGGWRHIVTMIASHRPENAASSLSIEES